MRRVTAKRGLKRIFREAQQTGGSRQQETKTCRGETVAIQGTGVVNFIAGPPCRGRENAR